MSVTVYSAQVVGLDARPISVEVDITPGLHIFSIVGLADKEVQESRERISAAIKNVGAPPPHKKSQRVIVNLAPADIRKEGPAFDLAIALGYLLASGQLVFNPKESIFLGELGLDGMLRKVSGVLPVAIAASASGFKRLFVPKGNGAEAAMINGIDVIEGDHLADVIEHLAGRKVITPLPAQNPEFRPTLAAIDFKDIRGQEKAKRALEIAAAGNHNVLLWGSPGSGKTILARALSSILPPLTFEESLEVSKIYSITGLLNQDASFVRYRPFRSPHHTASHSSIIGGGIYPRPGEVTLAHRGVLFLDEFAEFERRVIESLRQPLEERYVTITRTQGTQTFPAQFMLIAAMNPCPCGHYGNPVKDCICTPGAVAKYTKKISGPMLDRIDIHVNVPPVEYDKLQGTDGESSEAIRSRVEQARKIQAKRFRNRAIKSNAEMGLKEIKEFIPIGDSLKPILRMAHERYRLSARAYHRLLKLSRTIADLTGSEDIQERHLTESLQYRPQQET